MNVHLNAEELKSSMKIMDQTGHTTVKWDPANNDEVEVARATFRELKAKGFRAFRVQGEGKQGERIDTFDPQARQLILMPQLVGG